MKTFKLNQIEQIKEFQFLSDTSGIVLDSNGQLYRFDGDSVQPIRTPDKFKISHFHFISESYGAIVGNGGVLEKEVQQNASLGDTGLLLTFSIIMLFLGSSLRKRGRAAIAWVLFILATSGITISCSSSWQMYKSQDPTSEHATLITRNQLKKAINHTYVGNKGQTAFIGITRNKGKDWSIHKVPTNFHVTATTAIGQNFFVGTYANKNEGSIPIHGDGDIWIYGNDSTYSKQLSNNSSESPYMMAAQRGIEGLKYYPSDSLLFIFGTETERTFPKNELSATNGNIYQVHASLKPNYKIIDIPDTVSVQSLAKSSSGDIWVTLDDKKLRVVKGRTMYDNMDAKKLLRFQNGDWSEVSVNNVNSFKQVEFIPGTETGYIISEKGEVYETLNEGNDWQKLGVDGVEKVSLFANSVVFLKKNVLVLHTRSGS